MKFCAARAERLRIQRRDLLLSTHSKYRFSAPHKRRSGCDRLVVDGKIVTDLRARLDEWAQHFGGLAESNTDSIPALKVLSDKVDGLVGESLTNDEHLLDVPFSAVEVTGAVKRLKNRKSPGPDGVMAEHLKAGGESIIIWLMNILNAVVDLEVIPDLLKVGIVVPVYKGGGKDPLQVNSYRGITLSSMVGKVLEFLLLERLVMVFQEADIPHVNQTAYIKRVSCADAVFATQEVIARYLNSGDRVFMCLYDLQKAFDSVEYPVLLDRLYEIGVNGKMWRLVKNWYEGGSCKVKLDGDMSESYTIERGVKQGSVLSPALFLLVMNPLLKQLQEFHVGLFVNSFYAGGFLHADDIRTLASSESSLHSQVALVKTFTEHNFLKLNTSKCEIVLFGRGKAKTTPECDVDGSVLPVGNVGKCLGFWWKGDLMATKSVKENISKARRAYFHWGNLGAFQGDLNPLLANPSWRHA